MSADPAELTRIVEDLRPRLAGLAYQLVGSAPEADDIVQEAFLRWHHADPAGIRHPWSWLAKVVSRIALDHLRSARHRREHPAGTWLPAPPVELRDDPADLLVFDEAIATAMLVVLETLTPAQRVVFVLRDVFEWPFATIAEVVGRTPQTCRQLAARARLKVRTEGPRTQADPVEHRAAVDAFRAACVRGDLPALLRTLDHDIVIRTDGGRLTAARKPIHGAERAGTYLSRILAKWPVRLSAATVGGAPGIAAECHGQIVAVASVVVRNRRVAGLDILTDPAKLAHVPRAMTPARRLEEVRTRRR
ncbi:RNA polymerase sigma factor SigJ [Amycolatopsis pithecellobii]|uniref:RNA polymerase sigma factor SigJ n=1 Tax=Amycolatopsis pithecellobii TaxID=664692 RepID=UPI00140E6D30|nr:RNA polymerase sigma factor SigJ [Amycolatopsis pithecellobii]